MNLTFELCLFFFQNFQPHLTIYPHLSLTTRILFQKCFVNILSEMKGDMKVLVESISPLHRAKYFSK